MFSQLIFSTNVIFMIFNTALLTKVFQEFVTISKMFEICTFYKVCSMINIFLRILKYKSDGPMYDVRNIEFRNLAH